MPRKTKKSTSRKSKKMNVNSLFQSKMMLYLSLTLFIFNILAFLFYRDMQSLFLFVIVLCITYLFDQNMIIVLLLPTLLVGSLIFLRKSFMNHSVIEGFKESHDPQPNKEEDKEENDESYENNNVDESNEEPTNDENNSEESEESEGSEETEEVGASNSTSESYANLNNSKIKSELSNLVNNYEKAQKGLSETLEKSKLDPQSLETQKAIIKQMNQITPVIKDSVKILNKVDINGLNNLLGSLGGVIGSNPIPKPLSASTKI